MPKGLGDVLRERRSVAVLGLLLLRVSGSLVTKAEIGSATLYLGDCRDVLPEIGECDLLLTDPPYGVEFKSGKGDWGAIKNDHAGFDVRPYLELALKKLKRGRHVYVFGAPDLAGLLLGQSVELVWDKGMIGMGNLQLPWGPQHERITFAVYELSKANLAKGYGALAARLRKGSVLRSLRPNSARVTKHPTEKPVDILAQMVESSSVMGETVLDPFMGSGSTVVAALREGRRAIGIELDPEYFKVACERAEAETAAQQRLFA